MSAIIGWPKFISGGGGSVVPPPPSWPSSPDFTYNLSDQLIQIDYISGEQKVFTYSGDQLTRVDYIIGTTTYRKDFTYTVGGLLDYITTSTF